MLQSKLRILFLIFQGSELLHSRKICGKNRIVIKQQCAVYKGLSILLIRYKQLQDKVVVLMSSQVSIEQDEDIKPPSWFNRLQNNHFVHGAKIMESKVKVLAQNQIIAKSSRLMLYEEYVSLEILTETFVFPLELTITFTSIKQNLQILFRDGEKELEVTLRFQNQTQWSLFLKEIKRQLFQTDFEEKYGIMQKLGSGRHSQVYKIIQKSSGIIYAAKHYANIPSSIQKQLKKLRLLEHPNIIYFHEMFLSQGGLFMVMDFEDGGSLLDQINKEEFPSIKEKTKFLLDMLNGLEFLRIKGIVHRDLKPENILYSKKDDIYKISDFDLAIFANEPTPKTVGTPGYIAPQSFDTEQDAPYTFYSDIYSLGLIYYQLATKKTYYSGDTTEKVLHSNRKGKSLKKIKYSKEHISDLEYDVIKMMVRTQTQKRLLSIEILQSSQFRKLVKDYSLGKKSQSSSSSSKKQSPHRITGQFQQGEVNIEEENFMNVMKKILRRKTSNS